jgi:adenine-specific DNA-methyltransferase
VKWIPPYYKFKDDKYVLRGPFRRQPLATKSMDERPNLRFPINWEGNDIWPEKQWQWSKDRVVEALKNDELVFTKKFDSWTVDYKQYLKDERGKVRGAKPYSILEGPYTQIGTGEIEDLFGDGKVFSFPKPSKLIRHFIGLIGNDDLLLDFFSGSGTTANAVLDMNAEDNGNRKFIMVQLPEPCDEKSEAYKAGYKNIAEIGKERIRRACKKIKEENQITAKNLDTGFRVFKVDTSNMRDVYYTPDELKQRSLDQFKDHIKPDRRPEDLLFQVFIDWGIDLSLPIIKEAIDGKTVFSVDTNALIACFDAGINEELVKKLAYHKPLRMVFRDDAFGSDSVKINVEQIFKLLSPGTEVKSI